MVQTDQIFTGGVFHHSLPDGRAGAEIVISPIEIVATTLDAEPRAFVLKLSHCQLELGGASGRMLFCRNEDRSLTIFSDQRGFSSALSDASFGVLDDKLRELFGTQRRQKTRGRFLGLVSLVALAVVGVALYFGTLAAARLAVRALPISVDEKIGAMAAASMTAGGTLPDTHSATVLVRSLVSELRPHSAIPELDFRVEVIDDPQVNAFALPGGRLFVYTGLIRRAESAEQIAGVLAHEMAHATLRHGLQKVSQSLGIIAAVQLMIGDVGGLVAFGSQVAQESVLTSYSRSAETEADLEGARMLHAAGLDPLVMGEFFEILKHEHEQLPAVLAWISTHPQHEDRIAEIRKYRDSLPAVPYRRLELSLEKAKLELAEP
jgi:Zn-dependent protease with chaperone function